MEIKEWIMILSALVVVIGWFVNNYLNHKYEIAKQRLGYRLNALSSSIPIIIKVRDNSAIQEEVDKLHVNLQLYANKNELEILNTFIETSNPKKLDELLNLLRKNIRTELDLEIFEP